MATLKHAYSSLSSSTYQLNLMILSRHDHVRQTADVQQTSPFQVLAVYVDTKWENFVLLHY